MRNDLTRNPLGWTGIQVDTKGNRMSLDVGQAYDFYRYHLYREDTFKLLKKKGFRINGTISPAYWELFGSILTRDKSSEGHGADLCNFEIKTSCDTNHAFEYQYHRNGGVSKLREEMSIEHVFITYGNEYRDVTVQVLEGYKITDVLYGWLPKIEEKYNIGNNVPLLNNRVKQREDSQRCRMGLPRKIVDERGVTVMAIREAKLVEDLSSLTRQLYMFAALK